jgi:hypothetical protein
MMQTMKITKIEVTNEISRVWVEMLGQNREVVFTKWIGEDKFLVENPKNVAYAKFAVESELAQVFSCNPEVHEALCRLEIGGAGWKWPVPAGN